MGPLNYEVCIEGHTHQAHIDHLLPCPNMETAADTPSIAFEHSPPQEASKVEDNQTSDRYPLRCRNPPKRLIEELN